MFRAFQTQEYNDSVLLTIRRMLKDPFDFARAAILSVFLMLAVSALLQDSGVPIGLNQLALVSDACYDSDFGRNHFTRGTVTYSGIASSDSCYTATTLYENYCQSGARKVEYVNCPKGCSSGACVGSCFVGVTLTETKSGDSSSFTLKSTAVTSEDASPLINKYYAEEPSPFRAETLNSSKVSLGKYELWSGRYIIAETFSNPPQGELIELPSAVIDLFLPLNPTVRSLNIYQGTATSPISSIYLDESKLVCMVGQ